MSNDGITPEPSPNSVENVQQAPEPVRFDTMPYQVTGPSPIVGTLLLFTVLPVAGILVGLLFSVIAQWMYLVQATVDVALEQRSLNDKGKLQTTPITRVRYPGDVLAFLDGYQGPA
jgi:hypothetical protein